MDSTDLYYFLKVAETGGIREAAKFLNLAPSAVSRRINRIENQLNTRLFDRSASGTVLTATGRRCLTYVHETIAAKQRLLKDIDAILQLQAGHIYVACTEGQLEFTSRAVTEFQEQFPKIGFDLKIMSAFHVLEAIETGKADLGIAFAPKLHPSLESAVQIDAPLFTVVDPSHPLAQHTEISFKETCRYPLVLPPEGFAIRRIFDKETRTQQLSPHIALCTDSIHAIKTFIRNHGSIGILSYMSIARELHDKTLVAIPFTDTDLKNTKIKICVQGRRRLPPAISTFLKYLRVHATPDMLSKWVTPPN